eukprot:GHVT01086455.1.p1 GENE.GHVT01086455.1~~GHVT01086455.1.p1  ORF type:complete len:104 (+),score=2.97 GHVT01086455.1:1137-1448(+)
MMENPVWGTIVQSVAATGGGHTRMAKRKRTVYAGTQIRVGANDCLQGCLENTRHHRATTSIRSMRAVMSVEQLGGRARRSVSGQRGEDRGHNVGRLEGYRRAD